MSRRLALLFFVALAGLSAVPGAQTPLPFTTTAEDLAFINGAYTTNTKDLVAPKPIKQPLPRYTPEAMRAKIQGVVWVQIVVMPDGTVGRARIVRSLDKDLGLDAEALAVVKTWTFQPGHPQRRTRSGRGHRKSQLPASRTQIDR